MKSFLKRLYRYIFKNASESDFLKDVSSVGVGVECDHSVQLIYPDRIKIGNHVYIGPRTQIFARGTIVIHDHTIIGPETVFQTSMHNYKEATMIPYDNVELIRPVVVERCVWIGMRALIMPGVTIGEGCIIGAGSVVTKSCAPCSIMAGNPAVKIGERDKKQFYELVDKKQFYLMLKQERKFDKVEYMEQR